MLVNRRTCLNKQFLAAIALFVAGMNVSTRSSAKDTEALAAAGSIQEFLGTLVGKGGVGGIGERYESLEPLHCPNGARVSAPYFQWIDEGNGLVRKLGRINKDAPFMWILKNPHTHDFAVALYAEVGGSYTRDQRSRYQPTVTDYVTRPHLAIYDVAGSPEQANLTLRGYAAIATAGICRIYQTEASALVPELNADVIRNDRSLSRAQAQEAANNSWLRIPPRAPLLRFYPLSASPTGTPRFRLEIQNACGSGVPLSVDYVMSASQKDGPNEDCQQLPKRITDNIAPF